jgi:2-amino-4-hydroxy-6-hydroxymethyldihydropteridine diphosphokinase
MSLVYLALGANIPDRLSHLNNAVQGLQQSHIGVLRTASIYETEPHGFRDQAWFLNTVAEIETDLDPPELLRICLSIEHRNNRKREFIGGPRTLDIDIIFYDKRVIRTSNLVIPHPRFASRRFVLVPMAELAPDFIDPVSCDTIASLLARTTDDAAIRYVREPLQV